MASFIFVTTGRFRGVSHDHPEEATNDPEEITGHQAQHGEESLFDKECQTGSERSYFPAPFQNADRLGSFVLLTRKIPLHQRRRYARSRVNRAINPARLRCPTKIFACPIMPGRKSGVGSSLTLAT